MLPQACQKAGSSATVRKLSRPTQVVRPLSVLWKASRTSRIIGYQEKTAKQRTAPMRKPWAVRLRRRDVANRPVAGRGSAAPVGAGRRVPASLGIVLRAGIVAPWCWVPLLRVRTGGADRAGPPPPGRVTGGPGPG
ncbi:hypothetical protein GCM10019017_01440 [Streptomyces showdoensis]